MANMQHSKMLPTDLTKLIQCPTSRVLPSIFDRINELYDIQEETLLAIMAAGVPANCIAIIPPHLNNRYDFKNANNIINIGFEFIGSV